MEVIVYVMNQEDKRNAGYVLDSLSVDDRRIVSIVNLISDETDGVPSTVIDLMMLNQGNTFPLTVINGYPVISGRLPNKQELEEFLRNGVSEPVISAERLDNAVDLPTKSRVHISLDVSNLIESLRFYKVLFNHEPTKLRSDYAKFELDDPPLVITLNHFGRIPERDGPINHFGIQVKSVGEILVAKKRCLDAGFSLEEEVSTACCYAVQTKIWAVDPDGTKWEFYVVTDPDVDEGCGPDCICWKELKPSLGINS